MAKSNEHSKEDATQAYEEYLLLLQERNRLLKKLRAKDSKQQELERREQGFSLYINGANVDLRLEGNQSRRTARKTRTAGHVSRGKTSENENHLQHEGRMPATAPSKTTRKGWGTGDGVKIKTESGAKLEVSAPDKISGNYSEDFEVYQSYLESMLEEEDLLEGEMPERSDEDDMVNIDQRKHDDDDNDDQGHMVGDDQDDESGEHLTFTLKEVRALRESLENDEEIRRSIKEAALLIKSNILDDVTEKEIDRKSEAELSAEMISPAALSRDEGALINSQNMKVKLFSGVEASDGEESDIAEEIDIANESSDFAGSSVMILGEEHLQSSPPKPMYECHQKLMSVVDVEKGSQGECKVTKMPKEKGNTSDNSLLLGSSTIQDSMKREDFGEVIAFKSENHSKCRPLSASRKKRDFPILNSNHIKPEEVVSAIAKENQSINQPERGSRTAPPAESAKYVSEITQDIDRPNTVENTSLNGETISLITEKVKKMDSSQQLKLLKLLTKIETLSSDSVMPGLDNVKSDDKEDSSHNKNVKTMVSNSFKEAKHENNVSQSPPKHDVLLPVKPLHLSGSYGSSDISMKTKQHILTSHGTSQCEGLLEVVVEVLSNWGHKYFTGVTEFQFFDLNGKLIKLDADSVELTSDHSTLNSISNLLNGKTKTTKDKYMWKCKNLSHQNVEILFRVPYSTADRKCTLHKIVIWNYNRSLKELTVGIKDIRIFIGDELIWTGIVDKGCGNKMFDYGKEVILRQLASGSPAFSDGQVFDHVVRCETRTLCRDHHDISGLPIVDLEAAQPKVISPEKYEDVIQRKTTLAKKSKSPSSNNAKELTQPDHNSDKREIKQSLLKSKSVSTPELESLLTSVSMADAQSNSEDKENTMKSLKMSDSDVPIWLTKVNQSNLRRSASTSPEVSDPFQILAERGPPSSGRRSAQSSRDQIRISLSNSGKKVISGRRSGSSRGFHLSNDVVTDYHSHTPNQEPLPTMLDDSAKEKETQPLLVIKRGSISPEHGKSRTASSRSKERTKFQESYNKDIEESLRSIDKFEKDHRGRITKDVDLSQEGDIMDDLLKTNRKMLGMTKSELSTVGTDNISVVCEEEQFCQIPVLPSGIRMIINIKSTWGDRHYVGLNGIEIFESSGKLARIVEIEADPQDINVLPEYENDPRVISNIIDGVYMTRDDMHLWLTPFTSGQNHLIYLKFDSTISVAMMRIWNYNKSRIHSFRGAKDIEITLDDRLIFKGEIARASGVLSKLAEPYGDLILFTTDEDILEAVSENDLLSQYSDDEEDQLMESICFTRPSTSDLATNIRPMTCAKVREPPCDVHPENFNASQESFFNYIQQGCYIQLNFVETWGDPHYVGLTGIEILDESYESLPINFDLVTASPKDLNDLPDYDNDDRTLDKLFDGNNITMSDEHMWMIPFVNGEDHILSITFPNTTSLSGVRIWNYNKSLEDTYRGAKIVHVAVDGEIVSPPSGYLLRKGPGHCHFDFAQDILFADSMEGQLATELEGGTTTAKRHLYPDYEPLIMPAGFVFQFRLVSSWGDPYYIGLNGIQLFDGKYNEVDLSANNITAYPDSVNVLNDTMNDIRTPDKLIDGTNDTYDGRHMWLAPMFPGEINTVYVVFDQPVTVSMVKLWNYSKTPERGAQQFAILVDDLLVYNGILPRVDSHSKGILPTIDMPVPHHTVLFTDDEKLIATEKEHILRNTSPVIEQDIQLTNDRSVVNPRLGSVARDKPPDQAMRPMTSLPGKSSCE